MNERDGSLGLGGSSERDGSLDMIKGIGCIMMIPPHIPAIWNDASGLISYIGGFAPVLFFAVAGVTAKMQASRTPFTSLVSFYVLFALLGLSYNAIFRPHYWDEIVSDIPQIIAFGVLTIAAIEKTLHPRKFLYILLSVGIFLAHYFYTNKIQPFPFKPFLFAEGIFPIVPWLLTFFAGIFAYHIRNYINLILAIAAVGLLALLNAIGLNLDIHNKWNMSIGYVLISYALLFLAFFAFRLKSTYSPFNFINFIGKHSLLFLYVHLLIGKLLELANKQGAYPYYLTWPIVLAATLALMFAFNYLARFITTPFDNLATWMAMLFAILFIPVFVQNQVPLIAFEIILGLLFATQYRRLSRLIKTIDR